ncbi:hypothetical protein LMH87_000547 [Akanthomyces muscarius]|uniref:Uncharacterized protein n=1 Tax=Akanthomyces muscarius TaxID=2231603 RepID=A0A9W8QER9_AKAMU|nr:hypothetical protein LMH87_000547 [Akanthomyces muscarius]KAJ4155292.1 hypothetical protein LMH87_000547 [Akanthomyces muscarius]
MRIIHKLYYALQALAPLGKLRPACKQRYPLPYCGAILHVNPSAELYVQDSQSSCSILSFVTVKCNPDRLQLYKNILSKPQTAFCWP